MSVALACHPTWLEHDPGNGHPESPERLRRILAALRPLPDGATWVDPMRSATRSELRRVHDASYVERILLSRGTEVTLDHETRLSAESVDAALHAVGATLELTDHVLAAEGRIGMALTRPPGHHALLDQAMGYCVFNNVALAAAHARARGVERILILDWDAHHGNGTQAAFWDDPHVLFIDIHQQELFPPGGRVQDCGGGRGRGYTVNVPVPVGSGDRDYALVFDRVVRPLAAWYRPQLVFVSCGFDGVADDPEAGLRLTPAGFAYLAAEARAIAQSDASGRLVLVLEGGYELGSLGRCVRAVVESLAGEGSPLPLLGGALGEADAAVDEVVRHLDIVLPDWRSG